MKREKKQGDDLFVNSVIQKVRSYKRRRRNRTILLSSTLLAGGIFFTIFGSSEINTPPCQPSKITYQLLAMNFEDAQQKSSLAFNIKIPLDSYTPHMSISN